MRTVGRFATVDEIEDMVVARRGDAFVRLRDVGYAELSKMECTPGSPLDDNLENLLIASNRASGLIKQILAFSRQSGMEKSIIDPADSVKESIQLLRSTLPATIQIEDQQILETLPVFADPSQLNQIVINLATKEVKADFLNLSADNDHNIENRTFDGLRFMQTCRAYTFPPALACR